MRQCNDTITVFNARADGDGYDMYVPSIIRGVHWFCEIESVVTSDGLKAANKFIIRIPVEADMGRKTYVDPRKYPEADKERAFTLRKGDFIVHGAETEELTPSKAQEKYGEIATILGVTDNRDAPRGKHWKVVGS